MIMIPEFYGKRGLKLYYQYYCAAQDKVEETFTIANCDRSILNHISFYDTPFNFNTEP